MSRKFCQGRDSGDNSFVRAALMLFGLADYAAEQGWYPHEGGLLQIQREYPNSARSRWIRCPKAGGWAGSRCGRGRFRGQRLVAQRGKKADPIIVFDPSGKYLRSWARACSRPAHGLRVDKDDNVFVTDITTQQVIKFTREGKVLLALGTKGVADRREDFQSTDRCRLRAERRVSTCRTATATPACCDFHRKGKFLSSGKPGRGSG